MVLLVLLGWEGSAHAVTYWLRLARTPTWKQAAAKASLIQKDWTRGGRLLRVMVHQSSLSTSAGKSADAQKTFDVLVGPFDSLPAAVIASYRFQSMQPWLDKGWALGAVPLVVSGLFLSAPIRFTAKLATVCQSILSNPEAAAKGPDQGNHTLSAPRKAALDQSGTNGKTTPRAGTPHAVKEMQKLAGPDHPMLAEALVARGFGYAEPRPYVPPKEQSIARFLAWDRLLVWGRREVCQKTPKVVGGPKPHFGPGPKDMTPQVHPGGKRCLEWISGLTPDMQLAWFPASQLAISSRFKKATLSTRWGPVRIRYSLIRLGRSPRGLIYQAVVRSGGFPPVRKTIVISNNYPPPHRLGFDRLGAAIFEGRGLIVRRITVTPPSPPVPALWKMRRFKQHLTYHPE